MKLDPNQIDGIVREVMRRLLAGNGSTVGNVDAKGEAADGASTLVVSDRVVTMDSVKDRLVGVARVHVQQRAIVTPLVCDELREHGILLERHEISSGTDARNASMLVVGSGAQQCRVRPLLAKLNVQAFSESDLEAALARVAESGSGIDDRVLVMSSAWASIVCRANRKSQLRATVAWNRESMRQASQQMDVNVVVVDDTRVDDRDLNDVVDEYVRGQ